MPCLDCGCCAYLSLIMVDQLVADRLLITTAGALDVQDGRRIIEYVPSKGKLSSFERMIQSVRWV
jgi:hypothetical protein